MIQNGTQNSSFRLYFVETPVTQVSTESGERGKDQAQYFTLDEASVLACGQSAKKFTGDYLKGEFTVLTRWEDARKNEQPCYYACIIKDGRYLSQELVRHGLARIYGMPSSHPLPGNITPRSFLNALKRAERQAQRQYAGIWASAQGTAQMAGMELVAPNTATSTSALPAMAGLNNGLINLNTATSAELETLPGIGPSYAAAIIRKRPIETLESLTKIAGLTPRKVDAIRHLVRLSDPLPPPQTVAFYKRELESYLNTNVTVLVDSIAKIEYNAPETFQAIQMKTANQGQYGGQITCLIPEEFFESFLKHYSFPGREFTGLLYQYQGETVLVHPRQ